MPNHPAPTNVKLHDGKFYRWMELYETHQWHPELMLEGVGIFGSLGVAAAVALGGPWFAGPALLGALVGVIWGQATGGEDDEKAAIASGQVKPVEGKDVFSRGPVDLYVIEGP
jgi:hypothetical protein